MFILLQIFGRFWEGLLLIFFKCLVSELELVSLVSELEFTNEAIIMDFSLLEDFDY